MAAVGGFAFVIAVMFLVASVSPSGSTSSDDEVGGTVDGVQTTDHERPDVASVYDPVTAGEETPRTFRQLLQRDQIEPVYDPSFTDAHSVEWPDEMLVIGVEGVRTAKAYPVTHLNSHEMVIDVIDGDPILVSW